MAVIVPVDIITMEANRTFYFSILVGFIGLVILALVIWLIAHNITRPLKSTTALLRNLALGNLHNSTMIQVKSKDELGEMAESALFTVF
jgi:methyl-accepting chemotaxis protein